MGKKKTAAAAAKGAAIHIGIDAADREAAGIPAPAAVCP